MIWLFDREQESLTLESRYDNDTAEFVATVRYPNGRQKTERFKDKQAFGAWLMAFERDLAVERWRSRSGPVILPYGWPNKPLT